ncbi:hypothetical protein Aperf_G00000021225 [Anoplocephala perfoliata]
MEGKGLPKTLSEENSELKQYIESLNKECMDLQAALFEEANKMAQTAYAAEYAAKRRADEFKKENSVLRKEVQALKNTLRLHIEGNSDVFAASRTMPSLVTPEAENKSRRGSLRRLSFLRLSTNSLSSSATLPSSLPSSSANGHHSGDHRPHSFASSNGASREPVTRRCLLDALTSSAVCAETVAEEQFQVGIDTTIFCQGVGNQTSEFLDWVDGGCCIAWPGIDSNDKKQECTTSLNISYIPVEGHDTGSDKGQSERTDIVRTSSDVDVATLPQVAHSDSRSSPPPSTAFFHRLVREDIAPALDFADVRLCAALRLALGHLGVEIEPLSSLSISSPNSPVAPGTPKCPLVPSEPVRFRIKLETVNENGAPTVIRFQISSWARQRIAAVADLFQYFSLIRRGLTGTPTTPANRSPSNSLSSANHAFLDLSNDSDPLMEPVRRHQFENIQRRRLNVALSRLGYGLPSTE